MSTGRRECYYWCPYLSAALIVVLSLSAVFVWGEAVVDLWGYDPKTMVEIFSTLIFVGTLVVGVLSYRHQTSYNKSKDYLGHSIDLLEKAYQVLSSGSSGSDLLSNRRRDWITTVRLIRAAQFLGDKITHSAQKSIYIEQFEYWRWQFHELINPHEDTRPPGFYAHHPYDHLHHDSGTRAPINPKSLAFMHRFIRWPEGVEDRMNDVEGFTEEEISDMEHFGPHGLGEHLRNIERCHRGEIQRHDSVPNY